MWIKRQENNCIHLTSFGHYTNWDDCISMERNARQNKVNQPAFYSPPSIFVWLWRLVTSQTGSTHLLLSKSNTVWPFCLLLARSALYSFKTVFDSHGVGCSGISAQDGHWSCWFRLLTFWMCTHIWLFLKFAIFNYVFYFKYNVTVWNVVSD